MRYGTGSSATMVMMASEASGSWRMVHPLSPVVNLLPVTMNFVRTTWPILVAVFLGRASDTTALADMGLLSFLLAMTVGRTLLHYATLRYRVVGGRLEIKAGLFQRQNRVIQPSRVQNVERVRSVLHRLTGLVELRIETASGTEVEGLLSALSEAEGQRLVTWLGHAGGEVREVATGDAVQDEHHQALVKVEPSQLLLYAATSTRLGAAVVGLGVLMELTQLADPADVAAATERADGITGVALLIVVMTGAWLVTLVTTFVAHFGFQMERREESLYVQEGLLTTRRVELKRPKVQRIVYTASWLRRVVGFGTLTIETASAGGAGGTERAVTMVPYMSREGVLRLLPDALPGADRELLDFSDEALLRRPGTLAIRRVLAQATGYGVLMVVAFSAWAWPMGLVSVVGCVVHVAASWLDVTHQRWRETDRLLMTRRGIWSRRVTVVALNKIQRVDVSQSFILRRYGLAEVVVRVAGSSVRLPLLPWDEAWTLASRLGARLPVSTGQQDAAVPLVVEGPVADADDEAPADLPMPQA